MATIKIRDIIALGTSLEGLTATDYLIYKDEEQTDLIDSSLHNEKDKYEWSSPLLLSSGEYYSGEFDLWCKVILWFGEVPSPPFVKKYEKEE